MLKASSLIVVAGLPASGKSTTISAIISGARPDLAERLAIGDPQSWRLIRARDVRGSRDQLLNRAVLHYDLFRPDRQGMDGYADDPALRMIRSAQDLAFVTVWAQPAALLERIEARGSALAAAWHAPWRVDRHVRRRRLLKSLANVALVCADGDQVAARYERWLAFAASFQPRVHAALDTTLTGSMIIPIDDLRLSIARPTMADPPPGAELSRA